jgi:hypothetical protein
MTITRFRARYQGPFLALEIKAGIAAEEKEDKRRTRK